MLKPWVKIIFLDLCNMEQIPDPIWPAASGLLFFSEKGGGGGGEEYLSCSILVAVQAPDFFKLNFILRQLYINM